MVQARKNNPPRVGFLEKIRQDYRRHKQIYWILIPVILFYILFCYMPIGGLVIAFKDFSPKKGIWGSSWVGLKHFYKFFNGVYAERLIRNTVLLNVYDIIFGFPMPILLALLIDELRSRKYRRIVQTMSYLPHFISLVVLCGLLKQFVARDGLFNYLIALFNENHVPVNLLSTPRLFRTIFIGSNIWQGIGWNSIIYLAALSGVDPQLYEAVTIDGGNRFHRVWHISIPSIMPTIIILFILRMGSMMNIGFEKVFLLYAEANYETSDVISTYVYRRGLLNNEPSFASAVGFFNSVINFILVVLVNAISRKVSETSLF